MIPKNIRNKNRTFIESKLYMIPKILGINTGYLEHVNGVIYYFRAIIPFKYLLFSYHKLLNEFV